MSNRKAQLKSPQNRVIPMRSAGERVFNVSDSPSKSLFEDFKKQLEAEELDASPSSASSASSTSTTRTPLQQPVAPERDFQKVPNSITRIALPSGYFKGKSKQVYDYLYSVTRGSFPAGRLTFKTRREIMKGAGIGSLVTVDAALSHLCAIGLIKANSAVGSAFGNEYEVLMPEEAAPPSTTSTTTRTTRTSGLTSLPQNLEELVEPFSGATRTTQVLEKAGSSGDAQTIIKTREENNDDERLRAAFGEFEIILDEAIKKHTGRAISANDKIRWKYVAEVLVAQIELIASRTTISNGPAVLAEHLQRHLNNKRVLEKMGLITPAEAKEMKEPVSRKQEIPFLFLCPDCKGTRMWNPDGKGMRPNCPHAKLEEAVRKAKEEGEI